jgi:hypothetical protein
MNDCGHLKLKLQTHDDKNHYYKCEKCDFITIVNVNKPESKKIKQHRKDIGDVHDYFQEKQIERILRG